MENKTQQEDLIRKYLEENNREAAIKLIVDLVSAFSKEGNFMRAEAFRDRIIEIDPMALTEIIRSAEIIEEAKREAIDKDNRETWARLYKTLSEEELNAFYFSLKPAVYERDESICNQGDWSRRLFFVNGGRLKVVYLMGGREVLLKTVEVGEIAGEDTFFSNSVCTTSIIALSRVELSYLDAKVLNDWKDTFPVLESKLLDFASRFEKIKDLLKARELDRRSLKRVYVSGKGTVQLISAGGNPIGKPFRVDVCDISEGGMCFLVHLTKRETASLLLGQRVNISYLHPKIDPSRTINQGGIIVAVRFHPFEDCAINVKFNDLISARLVDELGMFSHSAEVNV
jgi:CRP-like cAMP-binding protein